MSSEKNNEIASQSFEDAEKRSEPLKAVSPEAQRALAEAAERRAAKDAAGGERPFEEGGPAGLEPTRYGDWERKGIVSDF